MDFFVNFVSQFSPHKEHTLRRRRRLKHLSICKHNSLFNYTDNEMQRSASVDSPNFFKTTHFLKGSRELGEGFLAVGRVRGASWENKETRLDIMTLWEFASPPLISQ